jgi:uncharacterized protein (DUF924 family)
MEDIDELYNLYYYWYFSECNKTNYKSLNSVDIYNQWINVWFAKGELQKNIDAYLTKYEPLIKKYTNYQPTNLIETIALIILYDQIPRNIFRKKPEAYLYDSISNYWTHQLLEKFDDLPLNIKLTLIICLVHSENIHDHDLIKEKMPLIKKDSKCDMSIYNALHIITINHKDRIELFNRIPERNKILGRINTDKELIYLNSIY